MFERVEEELQEMGFAFPVGCDEAGRGPLAGPIVVACLFIANHNHGFLLADSKQLTPKTRSKLFAAMSTSQDFVFSYAIIHHERIDEVNILQATFEGLFQAADLLPIQPSVLLFDGNQKPKREAQFPIQTYVKGDQRIQSIAGASIIAKQVRDNIMLEHHEKYPMYGFDKNKGYATKQHIEAIRNFGYSPIHRKSFSLRGEPV